LVDSIEQKQARAATLTDRLERATSWMQAYVKRHQGGEPIVQFMGFQTEVHALAKEKMDLVVNWMRSLEKVGFEALLAGDDVEHLALPSSYSFKITDDLRVIAAHSANRVYLLALA
jgi:hypothetical protein